MELTNEFSVAAPVERAWATLLDVERIAPCMPGAALTSFDGDAFTGTVKVKLGPVNLTYAGKGRFVSKDDAAHRVVIEASGKDKRGTATAAATITGTLTPEGDFTRVHVVTDLRITGAPAQFGRGMIADVAGRLVGQFADCLAETIAAAPDVAVASAQASDAAVGAAIVTTTAAADPAAVSTVAGIAPGSTSEPSLSAEPATPAEATMPAAESAPATTPVATTKPAGPKPVQEVEPIDLLAVTGTSSAARRTVPYVVTFLAGAAVGALIVWLLS